MDKLFAAKNHYMSCREKTGQRISFLFLFMLCLTVSFSFYSKGIHPDNYNYAIEELHEYDANLFKENLNTENADFSPRFVANQIMSGLISVFGSSWAEAAAALIRFNYVLYALAFSVLAYRISSDNRFFIGFVISTAAMGGVLPSLGFNINAAGDVFLGTAIPVSLLGISLVLGERKRWLGAWAAVAFSALLHVHEGIWGGCVIGLLWVAYCWAKKRIDWKSLKGLPVYIAVILLVTVPSLVNTGKVDETRFVEIYAFIRTPHHLLLSEWGIRAIVAATGVALFPFIMLIVQKVRHHNGLMTQQMAGAIVLMAFLWFVLLAVEYFVTEVVPVSTVLTMYLPKCFKYVTFLALVLYMEIADYWLEQKKYLRTVIVIAIVFVPSFLIRAVILMLYLVAVILDPEDFFLDVEKMGYDFTFRCVSYGLTFFVVYIVSGYSFPVLLTGILLLVYGFVLPYIKFGWIQNSGMAVCLVVGLLCVMNGRVININKNGISYISGVECLKVGMGTSIWQLANDFKDICSDNITFLSDPDDGFTGAFQLVSEKNCYVSYKNLPSSKTAIMEWYDRILSIRGIGDMNAQEVARLLESVNLVYVLVRNEQFDVLDNSDLFDCVIKNDVGGMYILK